MKLYTEEQIKKVIKDSFLEGIERNTNYESVKKSILNSLTPIELPSAEEIKEYINSTPYYGHCTPEYCEGIEDGIRWILTKIQGGNK